MQRLKDEFYKTTDAQTYIHVHVDSFAQFDVCEVFNYGSFYWPFII